MSVVGANVVAILENIAHARQPKSNGSCEKSDHLAAKRTQQDFLEDYPHLEEEDFYTRPGYSAAEADQPLLLVR